MRRFAFTSGDRPKETIVIQSAESEEIQIHVGEDAKVSIALFLEGENALEHDIVVTVSDRAECDVLCIQSATIPSSILRQRSTIGAEATMTWRNVTLAEKVEQELQSRVTGAGSSSSIDWVFYAKGSEEQKLNVRNIFEGREGSGEITMKGVAEGRGHASARGLIDIGLHGGGTQTYLTQDVLMLDSSAKVDAVPSLEIKTNDVKASHSATVSRVTPEHLFYFASRGIPKREARRMFVQGFLGELVARIADESVKQTVLAKLEQKYDS